ncbi:MAG: hypothetical protein CLLPBCKN_005622 [Chroococcidiopsis cubana SAG 39.79]|uniref:Glycosyl transferase family 1 domain-containing protein n=2 Tax=Chroococcidiopsis TaxID=54298 RepID=A0AB37UPX2_9CYAN|nr:glycosyltransferase [Chroococcidiopsis cubana]MDZ4876202.1 hypothetical protein [Chroococcidiopsis cubana SAG 39.79]PSB60745.1 hypothetical protein C7B79_24595 [Chroococcidiopsis cubana CCALA 043]RUT13417.1 hypothetical protein DSM107010_13720 [Chroococcidiopsis cubana SAG 39.79]
MAASLPIICTRTFGACDLVIEGVNGFIVESENVTELVYVMRKLATSSPLRQSMSRASKLRFEEIFSADRMMQSLNKLYTSLSTIQI